MIELLRAAAGSRPDGIALRRIGSDGHAELTWSGLLASAEVIAAALADRGITRFALLEPDQSIVWSALAAASLCGAEICVYPLAAPDDAIAAMRTEFAHDVLLTSRTDLGGAVVDPRELLADRPRHTGEPPAQRPLLVLTTGTSGRPKAARHDWGRILRITSRIVPTPEQRWLLAYGLNQFGGLQILLHVGAAQATAVASESFKPRAGLAAMREGGVTHASGTPTFWRFLLTELRDGGPVPELEQITISGEAVPPSLIDQLATAFPRARISQIYAATEMGTGISIRDRTAGLPLAVLAESDDAEVQFRVVDGELHVRSKAGMLGYHGQESLAVDDWRATGDLVEIVGDRIEFRGRATDVINVGGVKVHPLPIEERVAAIADIALARAYGRPNKLVGSIVALDVVAREGTDTEAIRTAIREACADLPPASRPRSIQFVANIETGGNKMSRRSVS